MKINLHWFLEPPKPGREAKIVNAVRCLIVLALTITACVWILSTGSAHAQPHQPAVAHRMVPPHDPGPDVWAQLAAKKWHHHRHALHKSGGRVVPHKAVVKLDAYQAKHPSLRPWWKKGLDLGQCMFNSFGPPIWTVAWQSLCLTKDQSPTFRHINEQIIAVRIFCGGAAVVGFLKKGGEWGAVKKSAGCFFPAAVTAFESWLNRPTHTRAGRVVSTP